MKPNEFISRISAYAVADMRRTGVPASLTIAQAILESAWGESGLTKSGNNLFGIKGAGTAGSGTYSTKEHVNGKWVTIDAQFRHYHNWGESIADHSKLILAGTSDKPNRYHGVLGADYKTAAYAIRAGGYATDPEYPQLLIRLIEQYKLYEFDVGEDDTLNLTDSQRKQLVDTLAALIQKGVISDASWVDKAEKGTLTVSELTWLNTIILSRSIK
ncbi:glycoside hydrolase family 73 protein [Paenibacillus marinisediminis]